MSGMILCRSEYSKRPYYISNIGMNVYSIEEICYFIYNDIYLLNDDFFSEELFSFIDRDIKESELAAHLRHLCEQKADLSEKVLTILRYVDYYSSEEIEELTRVMEKLDTQNVYERLKARADSFFSTRRYLSAIKNYEDIIGAKKDGKLSDTFYGNVWHNMGCCYACMFDFGKAAECFWTAFSLNNSDKSKMAYYSACHLAGDTGNERDDEEGSDEIRYVAGKELEALLDSVADTPEYGPINDALTCRKEGRIGEYYVKINKLIEDWKNDYHGYIR